MDNELLKIGDVAKLILCEYHSKLGPADGMAKYLHSEVTIETGPFEIWTQSRLVRSVRSMLDNTTFCACVCCLQKIPPLPQREATSSWDDVIVWRPKEIAHV